MNFYEVFNRLPAYVEDLGSKETAYALADIRAAATEVVQLDRYDNNILAVYDDGDGGFGYAMYTFLRGPVSPPSSDQDRATLMSCVFRGYGYTGSLREMRHTYFAPDETGGYIYYLPLDATIAALTHLKKYFDGV